MMKKIFIRLIMMLLITITAVFIIGKNSIYAVEVCTDNTNFTSTNIPQPYSGVELWCAQNGGNLLITAATTNSKKYAQSTGTTDHIKYKDHQTSYNEFVTNSNEYIDAQERVTGRNIPDYKGNDNAEITTLNDIYKSSYNSGKAFLYSANYEPSGNFLDEATNQDKLFIFSAEHYDRELSEEEKIRGCFTIKEAQSALWYVINPNDTNRKWDDRGLGVIAQKYQEFYNYIRNNKFAVDAFSGYDQNGNKENQYVEETTINLNGENYNEYIYKNTIVEIDKENNRYILGPYYVDYTNGEAKTTDGLYTARFSTIDNITIYNQNGIDITSLGGSFKIAYSYKESNGQIEIEEGIITTIDGRQINGFESGREFYIVIDRGEMTPEQFKGFYVKVDFKYLYNITGNMRYYNGNRFEYSLAEIIDSVDYESTYTYQYDVYYTHSFEQVVNNECDKAVYDSNTGFNYCPGHSWTETATATAATASISEMKYTFRFTKTSLGEGSAQQLLGVEGEVVRHYATASVVITSEWEEETSTIEIYKQCQTDGESLFGAKFNITLNIDGRDTYGNAIKKDLIFTRITDTEGIAKVDTQAIKAEGVYLGNFTGTIKAILEETETPAGHGKMQDKAEMIITYVDGKITNVSGENTKLDTQNNIAGITIYNEKSGTPKIQIAKVDKDNNLIDAYFEVHVSYTDKDGQLVDIKNNIINGQTINGVLNLTKEDFANMAKGFDIEGYTGKITLDIVEIKVTHAYTISSDNKDITLEYKNGNLIDYTEYTDENVVVQYLYDNVKDSIYKYATGKVAFDDLSKYIQDFLTDWINKQQKNTELSYDDILAWLANYIEENKDDVMEVSTKLTTELLEGMDPDIVQVVVEDSIGDLPDIPDTPQPQPIPLFMTIGGKVFLDQTTTKASAVESNGLYDNGELLLSGIEVMLYKKDGTPATLVDLGGGYNTNPTITDTNGYYEFNGVDPFEDYYVVFKYNGMEYKNTISNETVYNSLDWSKSSKGSEIASEREALVSNYREIGPNTNVYDYYKIQSIYTEITARIQSYINTNKSYPDAKAMNDIYSAVESNHKDDEEISNKIAYIKEAYINAYAGYYSRESIVSVSTNETFPYYKLDREATNEYLMNLPENEIEHAKDTILAKLYPGQKQINLGLVQRDRTDLNLLTDIVKTTVSINGHDTTYEMNKGNSTYTQYIYEEDYNYEKESNENGIAFYTDDGVEFYVTYEVTPHNETLTDTAITEIVDYYDANFVYSNEYTTSKGNKIAGYKVFLNGEDITDKVEISSKSKYGEIALNNANTENTGYNKLYIKFKNDYMIKNSDDLKIELSFKMNEAQKTLYEKIYTDKNTSNSSNYSRLWEIGNYAEINGYKTIGGYIDSDSKPGNFNIVKYENAAKEYQKAYSNYLKNRSSDNARALKLALGRLTDIREDDAWKVSLVLTNSGYTRKLNGSVWEAISDTVKTATNLQNNQNGLLTYIQENGLKGIKVELVELENDGKQISRAITRTGDNGDYEFKSYIPGDYVVRFTYGEQDKDIKGKSQNQVEENLQVNGQYYQSTKANPNTDRVMYWYDDEKDTRYSDAYDDAMSRINQMTASIEDTKSTSSDYEFDGIEKVETYTHKDTIYAYTSTVYLEGEYVKDVIEGNRENSFYKYKVSNVDFGVTPRAIADMEIDKYVSNIKIYLQDRSVQLDADIDKDGVVTYLNDSKYANIVNVIGESNAYRDGLIETLIDEELLNGATLEITYTFTVSNNGEYDTIKYIYNSNKEIIGVIYYGEDYKILPFYESDRNDGVILYHDDVANEYSEEKYVSEEEIEVKTAATEIVDYIDPNLNFKKLNNANEVINKDWEVADISKINVSRKQNEKIMDRYNTIIRIKDDNKETLYKELLPEESTTTTLTLSKVLETTSTNSNDYEYSNLVELVKIHSDSGKITDLRGYDITGENKKETAEYMKITEIEDPIYPTIATSKSETLVIHAPTGLSNKQELEANTIIVLSALIVFATGIVLIKKVVIKTNKE